MWIACGAGVASVKQQIVVCVQKIFFWRALFQNRADFFWCFCGSEIGAVCHAEDMCVHGNGGLSEANVQYNVGGL